MNTSAPQSVKEIGSNFEYTTSNGVKLKLSKPSANDYLDLEVNDPALLRPTTVTKVSPEDYIEFLEFPSMCNFADTFMQRSHPPLVSQMRNMVGSLTLKSQVSSPVVIIFSEYNNAILCSICTQKLLESRGK